MAGALAVNTVVLDALTSEIDRVKKDKEFMARLRHLTERDKGYPRPSRSVRYLNLAEALVIAEAVTGIDTVVLANSAGVGLLDSALHAPQPPSVAMSSTPTSSTRLRHWRCQMVEAPAHGVLDDAHCLRRPSPGVHIGRSHPYSNASPPRSRSRKTTNTNTIPTITFV